MTKKSQAIPPKMLQQYVDKWNAGEGVAISENCREFAQGNNVICVFGPENATGHFHRDAKRAAEIREQSE